MTDGTEPVRVRFAPSPTGQLHVGNARTALFNWLFARHAGGVFLLRIEDTDIERSTQESEASILADLRWMGLDWDEGLGAGGRLGPYRQSERLAIYRAHADRLLEDDRAYYCFCSTEELERARRAAVAAGRPARYLGTCRRVSRSEAADRLAAGEPGAIRFKVTGAGEIVVDDLVRGRVAFGLEVIGDPVILRSDGRPAYNFAVVVDDHLMEVSHVIRGEDHLSNTPRQLLLYRALGFAPPRFAHLALVLGPDHTPLSKRHGATSVAEFRAQGYLPEALVNYLALVGWSPGGGDEILPLAEMARRFSLEHVNRSAGVFDPAKLGWTNRHYLREAEPSRIADLALPHFQEAGFAGEIDPDGRAFLADVVTLATDSVDRVVEIPERTAFLFRFDPGKALADLEVRAVVEEAGARDVIAALSEELAGEPRLDRERFRAVAARVRQRTGRKAAALFHPIRVALTGHAGGPELDRAVPLIDRGAELPASAGLAPVAGCRERAAAFAAALRAESR